MPVAEVLALLMVLSVALAGYAGHRARVGARLRDEAAQKRHLAEVRAITDHVSH